MNEEYQFLDCNGERLFAAHHRPPRPAAHGIVMCHALGEEKLWSHRVLVSFAREMAAAGFAVLRFDFRGEGDSSRDFAATDLESRIEDTCAALDAIRQLNDTLTEVTLLGLRFGAAVAAAAAKRRSDVSRLILWDPVLDGASYMQAVLRLNLMYQMAQHRKVVENREALVQRLAGGGTVNIEGYDLSEPLFRQASQFRLADALQEFGGDVLIVQVQQGTPQASPEVAELLVTHPRCRVEFAAEEPFWREIKTFYQRAPELTRISRQALEAAR